MRIKNVRLTILLFSAAASVAPGLAAGPDLSKLPPPAKQKGVTYAKEIRPILEASCFRCHGEERPKANLRLDSLEAVLKGGKSGKVIVPRKSDKSLLVIAVAQLDEDMSMPPKSKPGRSGPGPGGPGGPGDRPAGGPGGGFGPPPKPLTAEQVGLIRAWIDQGAQ